MFPATLTRSLTAMLPSMVRAPTSGAPNPRTIIFVDSDSVTIEITLEDNWLMLQSGGDATLHAKEPVDPVALLKSQTKLPGTVKLRAAKSWPALRAWIRRASAQRKSNAHWDLKSGNLGASRVTWQIDCLYQRDSRRYQTLLVCRYRSRGFSLLCCYGVPD